MSAHGVSHQMGRAMADGSWMANPLDPVGHMQYGPYTDIAKAGPNVAKWWLSVDNNSADNSALLVLDVYDSTADQLIAQRTVTRQEFAAVSQYQEFSLNFNLDAASQGHRLEFRLYHTARSQIQIKEVGVEAERRATRYVYDAAGRAALHH